MTRLVLDGAAVATVDPAGTEHPAGHLVLDGARIVAVGAGRYAGPREGARVLDLAGCLVTPGLVNTHHHLYQWATRGMAVDATLFEWLTALYPVWAGIDEDVVAAASTAALGWLARTGCTSTSDHHYVFPRGTGDLLGAQVEAARRVGLRFHPTRGSMDLGRSAGGLPPDDVVEDRDAVLAATEAALDAHHDPSPGSMVRVGIAPCSPFSVTRELMLDAAALARARGVRLHTHLAETADEDDYCAEHLGTTPVRYLRDLGWLGPDVWLAHAVHLDNSAVATLAATGTGVAHCPSSNGRLGAGTARTADLLRAGVPVGLGVDGAASNEATSMLEEVRSALLTARARGGPAEMGVRDALRLGTLGGARVLGRDDELGSLEPGKLADIAVWRLDTLRHTGIDDPVAALVLGPPPPLRLLLVNGETVVADDRLVTVDEDEIARGAAQAHRTLLARAEGPL